MLNYNIEQNYAGEGVAAPSTPVSFPGLLGFLVRG